MNTHCLSRLDDLKLDDDNGFLSKDTTALLPLKSLEVDTIEMPGPGSQLGTLCPSSEGVEGGGGELQQARNPLICCLCDDYYTDPCLLQCYHTFCSKCLRGREADGRLLCPLCGNITTLKDNAVLPPADNLMKQLIDMVNAENPPCANCDKRDRNSMFFCSTCGQSLCNQCRENTHRAKMFSTHDIVHMSKCAKESQKRCPVHGELYIMFNNVQKSMLCVTCFRDTPNETRMHCVDIDAAYNQSSKKLDRAVISLCEVQNSVRESLLMFKTLLEELRHNMDCEKHTINTFCQGMQESVAKTHSNMIMEVQRQYEAKERSFRGHLVNLSVMMPVIQHHLLLCQSFTNIANKFQFLDLASTMIDRMAAIAQLTQPQRPIQSSQIRTNFRNEFVQCLEPWIGKNPQSISRMLSTQDTGFIEQLNAFTLPTQTPSQPSKRQQNALRTKAMEGEGPFSNHCRSFDSQVKELSQQLSLVKERLNDLHRDVSLLRRAQTPPLITRYQRITGDCAVLEEQLERHQVELERMKNVFDTLWEEQMCRIHVEQDIFQSQTNEILTLRAEVKHLATVAQQLEPYIKSLINVQMVMPHKMPEQKTPSTQQVQEMSAPSVQLQTLLDHINSLQLDSSKFHSQSVTSPTGAKNLAYPKEAKERPRPKTPSQSPAAHTETGRNVIYESRQVCPSEGGGGGDKRGSVFSQLMEKVRTKDDRKKSLEGDRGPLSRDKSKSGEVLRSKQGLEDGQNVCVQKQPSGVAKSKGKKELRCMKDGKVVSVYQSISGRVLGSKSEQVEVDDLRRESQLPPPPPPAKRTPFQDQSTDIRERLETHLKEKLQEMAARGNITKHSSRIEKSHSIDADIIEDINYQRISEALSCSPEDVKATRVLVHRDPQSKTGSTSTSPRRQERRSIERERSRERRDKRDRSRDGRDRSQSRDRSKEERQKARPREGRERSRERRVRRDKYGRFYPASDTEDNVFYQNGVARKQHSFDSLTLSPMSVDSRKSSADMDDRKTLVLVIGNRKGSSKQKMLQRSWETFPPKKKNYDPEYYGGRYYRGSEQHTRHSLERGSRIDRDKTRGSAEGVLRKADSFEGHEEAVRTLVAAVHQTRSQQLQQSRRAKSGGHGGMPSPPPGKHRAPVIRQLSLQNQPSLQSPASRGLKKQLSEDDSRVLEAVGVTGQGWSAERSELRIGSGGGKIGPTKITGTRPKPVKVAWIDKKPECPAGVEVIATKCQGQPRPTSLKNQRLRSPLLGNKDTLVYTRLQLAERLRNAWSEREKIKPNINIFLARAPDTTRSEKNEPATDRPPAETSFQDTASAFSDSSAPLDKKRKSMKVRGFSQEFSNGGTYGEDDFITSEPELTSEESRSDLKSKSSPASEEKEGRRLQELNKIEIRMTKIESGAKGIENKLLESDSGESSVGMKRCRNKTSESSAEGKTETDSKETVPGGGIVTAQDRRANFRRSSILHKTITESFSSSLPEKNFEENAIKTGTKPLQKKPPLIRAFSAPSQSDQASDINKAANLQKKVKMIPQRRLQPSVSFELSCTKSDDATGSRDRIKSAPVRRKLKSATVRRKSKDKDSSDEEKEPKESTANKKTTRRSQLKKGADIITMVSLVSPAASDTEDSLINLPMESWRGEEKEESIHGTKSSSANGEEARNSAGVLQKFVSLRKTTKSVTFQSHPMLGRGYSASFPSRRAPAGTPVIVPTPVISNPALTPAQLLEREKRAAVFSGINSDGRGGKRRLLRSSSEFPKHDYAPDEKSCETNKNGFLENGSRRKDDADGAEEKTNGEPDFKCPKERECWNLYQKMVEKGVSVSFDTVLRGMLTPTEYRLRKNQLHSNC